MNIFKNTTVDKRAETFHSKYIDWFFSSKCAGDMLNLDLFANAKEITESMAAYAATEYIPHDWNNSAMMVYAVGDGHRPSTGATFAFRTKWKAYSIDPLLRSKFTNTVRNLEIRQSRIEDVGFVTSGTALIVLVHAHVSVEACLKQIHAERRHVISLQCCKPHVLNGRSPDVSYRDHNVWSPHNEVKIWLNV